MLNQLLPLSFISQREDIIPRDAEEQASPREMELIERLKNSNAKLRAKLETARSSLTKMKAQRAVTGRARDPYAERRQVKALLDDKVTQRGGVVLPFPLYHLHCIDAVSDMCRNAKREA